MRPRLSLLVLVAATAAAQQQAPSILTNHGEPMRVGYGCLEEDLQWAGLSCGPDAPCPVYLELSAVAANGGKILAAGDLHSSSATLSSILLGSDDAGATWKEPAPRMRGDALDQVQIFDSGHAWAAGETQYPLPRDPFFLVTADAGASWRERPVGEDGNAGSIQRFWFDSPTHGELIIDSGKGSRTGRYVSYESETGGDSWVQRGAGDRLPALKHAAAGDPDWRVRPSADGKTWQIEKREGDTWSSAASFLIEVASCKQ